MVDAAFVSRCFQVAVTALPRQATEEGAGRLVGASHDVSPPVRLEGRAWCVPSSRTISPNLTKLPQKTCPQVTMRSSIWFVHREWLTFPDASIEGFAAHTDNPFPFASPAHYLTEVPPVPSHEGFCEVATLTIWLPSRSEGPSSV